MMPYKVVQTFDSVIEILNPVTGSNDVRVIFFCGGDYHDTVKVVLTLSAIEI